ncbi:helix-turn-helix transcriptional regulator [Megasphaera butyrica]|uniref:helix-turn-helix domain-containing protein n=1 Tax=Megasphaera TaxID=906 RepID=UPI0008218E2A|nr:MULTISPECIES: helix-turn-helix transcriptional regulator [Megasphaera]MCU6713623.1 helix-turn-helix transcriptional regulator [Megasphaera butyrica]SCH08001.1 Uncharacterised protein [uncultured Megasphaera sp.]SCI16316.1 Uncharacterised protein [uncultured Ruminococcus sp.]HJE83021.1 helix-turn-helix transcriptional regulator [Megasphaera stantonii]
MNIHELLKQYAKEQGMTLKEVAEKVPVSYEGMLNKFRRGSMTVKDLEKLLDVLNKELYIRDKKP